MSTEKIVEKVPKRCFVVMGYGIKTDFATGRRLDLNKTYKILIKPVVESKGLTCIRGDEIPNTGSIDLKLYWELLDADIVIADLSTANVNAFYELGLRHALRRRTTIVISEDKLAYPFDLNHIKITPYTHLGAAIDYEEVERFRTVLAKTIDFVLAQEDADSPVYTHLHQLIPPSIQKKAVKAIQKLEKQFNEESSNDPVDASAEVGIRKNNTLAVLAEQGEAALKDRDFISAKAFFNAALNKIKPAEPQDLTSSNSYLIHRLALATYKAGLPDKVTALKEAHELLRRLDLDHTNDPETVGLAGKIEKRLYEAEKVEQCLSNAILFFERGYYLLNNRYHGINLAFLLNKRVDSSIYNTKEDKIADMVWANRTRIQVLKMCEKDWNILMKRLERDASMAPTDDDDLTSDHKAVEIEQKFWILVNKAEAHFGLGQFDEYRKAKEDAKNVEHEQWMMESFEEQIEDTRALMNKFGHFLNPPWVEV